MRVYKFRAWDNHNNQMLDVQELNFEDCFYGGKMQIRTTMYSDYFDCREMPIMQYTGIKDENGIEIYEGDIIDFSYDMFVGNFDTFIAKGKIFFEDGAFYVECIENERTTKGEAYLLYSINIDTIEVIGNIYNNPELLEKPNE